MAATRRTAPAVGDTTLGLPAICGPELPGAGQGSCSPGKTRLAGALGLLGAGGTTGSGGGRGPDRPRVGHANTRPAPHPSWQATTRRHPAPGPAWERGTRKDGRGGPGSCPGQPGMATREAPRSPRSPPLPDRSSRDANVRLPMATRGRIPRSPRRGGQPPGPAAGAGLAGRIGHSAINLPELQVRLHPGTPPLREHPPGHRTLFVCGLSAGTVPPRTPGCGIRHSAPGAPAGAPPAPGSTSTPGGCRGPNGRGSHIPAAAPPG